MKSLAVFVFILLVFLTGAGPSVGVEFVTGVVVDEAGNSISSAFISSTDDANGVATTVFSDSSGRFSVGTGSSNISAIRVGAIGYRSERVDVLGQTHVNVTLARSGSIHRDVPSAAWLSLLPDGSERRKFILDCTGCHTADWQTMGENGALRTEESWRQRTEQMLSFAGSRTGFPIMSSERYEINTARWLTSHIGAAEGQIPSFTDFQRPRVSGGQFEITEYPIPSQADLPHDLTVDTEGNVVITGMISNRMYVLNPETGIFDTSIIPDARANPRANLVDETGDWWVLLGSANAVAHRDQSTGEWESWPIGMYGHSIAMGEDGRIWFNGHFTSEPELIGVLNPESGTVKTYEVPTPPSFDFDGDSSIPYGLRMGPGGILWGTQLAGNRLVRFDTNTRRFKLYTLPTTHSGPRRLDIAEDGTVWIPEYANNRLAQFDPESEEFSEYELPISNSLPYIVRVHPEDGSIWIATGAAGVVYRFHPESARFDTIPIPTPGALMRHMDIDRRTGDVWVAYGNSPARSPKVARIRAVSN